MKTKTILAAPLVGALAETIVHAQTAPKMKMAIDIPPEITTPYPDVNSLGVGYPKRRRALNKNDETNI